MRFSTCVLLSSAVCFATLTPAFAGFDFVAPSSVSDVNTEISVPVGDVRAVPLVPNPEKAPTISSGMVPAQSAVSSPVPYQKIDRKGVYPFAAHAPAVPLSGDRVIRKEEIEFSGSRADVETSAIPPQQPATIQEMPVSVLPVQEKIMVPPVVSSIPVSSLPAEMDLAVVDGFGNNIPLSLAIEQVIPSDYTVNYIAQPDPDMIVSWSGNRPWNKVLEDMLYAHGYRVTVQNKTAIIFKFGQTVPLDTALAPNGLVEKNVSEMTTAPILTPAPFPLDRSKDEKQEGYIPAKIDIFSARSGENLHDVLGRWSDQSMVQMYWRADRNYILPQSVAYNTTYARAIQMILDIFAVSDQRPVADLRTNAPAGPAVLNVESSGQGSLTVR